MKTIKVPVPRFKFGQVLCIQQQQTVVDYADCEHCFNGKLKVIGPKGETKEVSCDKCRGSGHGYKPVARRSRNEIVGMLRITKFRCEINEKPDPYWSFEGISYQGEVVWKEDLEDDRRRQNVFSEARLLLPSECEPQADWTRINAKGDLQ